MGKPHWLQNPSLCKSIKRQHWCYFWTSVVFLKSFYQGFKCHKSLQHRVFYYWKQSSLWFWLWGAIKKSKEEHHLTNELANGDSACWAAPGFTLVWSKIHLKYHKFKVKAGLFKRPCKIQHTHIYHQGVDCKCYWFGNLTKTMAITIQIPKSPSKFIN